MLDTDDAIGLDYERTEERMQPGLDVLNVAIETEPPDVRLHQIMSALISLTVQAVYSPQINRLHEGDTSEEIFGNSIDAQTLNIRRGAQGDSLCGVHAQTLWQGILNRSSNENVCKITGEK